MTFVTTNRTLPLSSPGSAEPARDDALAADAARLSEARFRALIENSLDIVALFDARGRYRYASPAMRTVLGHAPEAVLGQRGTSLLHPADRRNLLEIMRTILAAPGRRSTGSFRMRHADGRWRWMEGTGHNLLAEPGVGAIVANFRDVTARHEAQTRLAAFAQLGQRLAACRTAVEAARVIIQVADDLIGWDACYLDQYAPAEDRQRPVLHADLIDGKRVIDTEDLEDYPPSRELLASGGQLLLRRPETEADRQGLRPFGNTQRRSASLMFVPIHYGTEARGILSIQSYTYDAYTPDDLQTLQALADHCGGALDRLQVEEALRAHDERFRALIENSSDAIALVDRAGLVRYASPSTAGVLGESEAALVGQPLAARVHPEQVGRLNAELAEVQRTPRARLTSAYQFRHQDGSWRWVEAVANNLLDVPSVQAVIINYRDISARKAAEASAARHHQELLTLNEIGRELSQLATPEETLRRVYEWLSALIDTRNVFLALYDEARQVISFPVYTVDGEMLEPAERPLGHGITEYVVRTRRPLLIEANMTAALEALNLRPPGRPSRSLVAVPLLARERVLGVLCVQDYEHEHTFGPHERDLLSNIALQAAVGLENARLYAASQQELAERRRAEASLREREALLSQMLELLPVGVWLADGTGTIQLGNAAGLQIWGGARYVGPEQMDLYQGWWSATGERLKAADWGISRAVRTGASSINEVIDIETFDGQRKTIINSVVPLRAADQTITGALVVNEDITERRQHERELEALAALSAALRQAATRAEMLPVILTHLLALGQAEGAAIVRPVLDAEPPQMEVELALGRWAHTTGTVAPLAGSPTARVLQTGQPFVSANARAEPGYATPNLLTEVMAAVCVPLVADEHAIGVVWVLRLTPYAPAEVRLLGALADMAANALRRASLHEQTQRRAEQLAALNALGRALSETLDLAQIYEHLYTASLQLLPDLTNLVISRYDAEADRLTAVFAVQAGERLAVDQMPPQALRVPAADSHDLPGLIVPMLTKGRLIGVMQVQRRPPNWFGPAETELFGLAANTGAIALENARLFSETERRLHYLQALHDIDRAITSSLDLRVTLNVLLDQALAQLEVDAAAVLLLNPHLQTLDFAAGRGFRSKAIEHSHVRLDQGQAGRAVTERQPVFIQNLAEFTGNFTRRQLLSGEQFVSYGAVPLIAKGEVKGVLDVFQRSVLQPTAEWRDFLLTLAGQAAIAIDNTTLFNSLQRSNTELSLAYDATIEGWSRALDLRDRETEGHTQRVASMTLRLARSLGLGEAELVHMRRGALLHDIGKMGIPDSILLKEGPLTAEEWETMRRHPVYAYELLRAIEFLRPALDIPYCHHEKWDGTGYPRGLRGEQIPLAARLFAVVDVWDALSSNRPYRAAWPAERVRDHIREQIGRYFDPQVAAAFLALEAEAGPAARAGWGLNL